MRNRKYYYCPIKAAYMSKYFDVKFESQKGAKLFYDGEFREEAMPDGIYAGEYYFVRDESLPIFEPHFVDMDKEGYFYCSWQKLWFCGRYSKANSETMIRNNMAFFMPKEEK